jgi:hypothetical protein
MATSPVLAAVAVNNTPTRVPGAGNPRFDARETGIASGQGKRKQVSV